MLTNNVKDTLGDVSCLSPSEIGLILYHIARKTTTSRTYTVEFIEMVMLRASDLLYMPKSTIVLDEVSVDVPDDLAEKLRDDWSRYNNPADIDVIRTEEGQIIGGPGPLMAENVKMALDNAYNDDTGLDWFERRDI